MSAPRATVPAAGLPVALPEAGALPRLPRVLGALAALVLTAAILIGGRVPDAVELFAFGWDKARHAVAYAVLAGCWCVALGGRRALLAAGLAISTGGLDEWLQRSLPDRQADLFDLLADALGALIGAWLAAKLAGPIWQAVRKWSCAWLAARQ